MDNVVVKRTFIEVADEPSEHASFEGLRGRSCSDSAVYDTFEKRAQEFGDLEEDGENFDFEITGISDTDSTEGSDRTESRPRLACYQYLAQEELPLPISPGTPHSHDETPVEGEEVEAGMKDLLSENKRLAFENQLLKENARLVAENASLKASSKTLQEPASEQNIDLNQASSQQCYMAAVPSGAWTYPGGYSTHFPMPMQAAFYALPWSGEQHMADGFVDGPSGGQRRRHRGYRGSGVASYDEASAYFGPSMEMMVEERTTVMLRNLPNNYTRAMVLTMLDKEGFGGKYDFLYLPIDFKTRACLGYAFVNLVSPSVVPSFWQTFDGYSKWALPSKKICGVTWSGPHQGLMAHVERYRNSPVMHPTVPEEYQPVVFEGGRRVPFPAPSKTPRAPRARNCGEGRTGTSGSTRRA